MSFVNFFKSQYILTLYCYIHAWKLYSVQHREPNPPSCSKHKRLSIQWKMYLSFFLITFLCLILVGVNLRGFFPNFAIWLTPPPPRRPTSPTIRHKRAPHMQYKEKKNRLRVSFQWIEKISNFHVINFWILKINFRIFKIVINTLSITDYLDNILYSTIKHNKENWNKNTQFRMFCFLCSDILLCDSVEKTSLFNIQVLST